MTVKDKINHPIKWETQPVTLTFTQLQNDYLILLGPGQALGQVSRLYDLGFETNSPSCLTVAHRHDSAMLLCHYPTSWVLWYNPIPQTKQGEGSRLETEIISQRSRGCPVQWAIQLMTHHIPSQCSQPCIQSFAGLWRGIKPNNTKVS